MDAGRQIQSLFAGAFLGKTVMRSVLTFNEPVAFFAPAGERLFNREN